MVSTSFPGSARDWRGRFIYDMAAHVGAQSGVNLSLWAPPGELPPAVSSATSAGESEWLKRMLSRGGVAHLLRRRPVAGIRTAARLIAHQRHAYRREPADVMHINWLQNALALWKLPTPAVITVLGSDLGFLRLPGLRRALRAVFSTRRAILAPNAEWMVQPLRDQFADVADISPVPFGVGAEWFEISREPSFAEPAEWIVVSRVTRDKIGNLLAWGDGLFNDARLLHLFGPMQERMELPHWVRYHGATHPTALQSTWFPKATGFITLSRHDEGRPQVMLEAMAAGVPVVASDLAAHRDFVRTDDTGFIVRNADEFTDALRRLEDPAENQRVGAEARAWVQNGVGTWDDCARRYVVLYRQLVESAA